MSRTDPTLKQLRYLMALAETRHFRRAAESCGISQPSLSVQIATLEERLGVPVVSRGRGPVTLTIAGREVLERAGRIAAELDALASVSARLRDGLAGTVRLGVSPTLGPYFLPHAVGTLHRAHPDLKLYIREAPPRQLIEDLGRGGHDLVLTQLPVGGADFEVSRLFRESLFLAITPDHPLAAQTEVTEADLVGLDILSLGPDFVLHEQLLGLCQTHGARVLRDYEGTSLDALRAMTALGMGCTLLPGLYAASEVAGDRVDLVLLPFKGSRVTRTIGLASRRHAGNEQVATLLTELFRDVARARRSCGLMIES
jgi:LysR family hydrogen peroxide-inducible transcriptional activator